MADDFCKFFDTMMAKYTLKPFNKRKYHRDSTMSKAEIMLVMILFHDSGYRCLKHFYIEKGDSAKGHLHCGGTDTRLWNTARRPEKRRFRAAGKPFAASGKFIYG
ncbi:hypothetical protein JCM15908A_08050 [Prevotella dentasini JCM 15908]